MSEDKMEGTICSFCGANNAQSDFIIRGDDANICGDCVRACASILAKKKAAREVTTVLGDYHRPDHVARTNGFAGAKKATTP